MIKLTKDHSYKYINPQHIVSVQEMSSDKIQINLALSENDTHVQGRRDVIFLSDASKEEFMAEMESYYLAEMEVVCVDHGGE